MSGLTQDTIARHLREAVARLQKDIEHVEVWAAALNCFARPIPDYEPDDRYRLGKTVERTKAGD
jgi:hypothetical protein